MILDQEAYRHLRLADEHRALSALTAEESLALGAALWTSELAAGVQKSTEPRGQNLARRLGIRADRLAVAGPVSGS
jgi:hypothetical protein